MKFVFAERFLVWNVLSNVHLVPLSELLCEVISILFHY